MKGRCLAVDGKQSGDHRAKPLSFLTRWVRHQRLVIAFMLAHAGLYAGALLLLGAFAVPATPFAILWTLALTLPVAFELSDLCLLYLPCPAFLPTLRTLSSRPKVALLYLTCDDHLASSLATLDNQLYE